MQQVASEIYPPLEVLDDFYGSLLDILHALAVRELP